MGWRLGVMTPGPGFCVVSICVPSVRRSHRWRSLLGYTRLRVKVAAERSSFLSLDGEPVNACIRWMTAETSTKWEERARDRGRRRPAPRWHTIGTRLQGLLPGLLLLPMLACSRPGEPAVRLTITHVDRVDGGAIDAAQHAELAAPMASSGSITLNGIMLVPDHCDKVRAHLQRDTTTLVLRIAAQLSSGHQGVCAPENQITLMQYSAEVTALPPGTYRLRVVHEYYGLRTSDPTRNRWRNRVAYEGNVTIRGR